MIMEYETPNLHFPANRNLSDFIQHFLLPNTPCMFGKEMTATWKSRLLWQKAESPNIHYLTENFGDAKVPVADCNTIRDFAHTKTTWNFKDYMSYWNSLIGGDSDNTDTRLLYLKDWHFVKSYPAYGAYSVPLFFSSDWMNEVWDRLSDEDDDYRFVYMGPAGTWTPFHADVFRSYSWSANVCGVKEWLLCRPGEEDKLRDKMGNLPADITSKELADRSLYPNAHKALPFLRVIQNPGEVIFVPSGWYHQVKNMEHTISINHNWTNGFGVQCVWTHLKSELALVEAEISDCREMEGWKTQCQLVLKASAGMDYKDFHQLLQLVGEPRLKQVQDIVSCLAGENTATTIEDLKDSLLQVFHQQCPSEHTSGPHLSSDFTIDTFLPLKFLLQFLPPSLCSAMELLCTFMLSSGHIDKKPLLAMLMIRAYELHQVTAILHELKQHLSSSVIPLSSSSPSSHYLFSSSNTDDLDYDSELTHIFTLTSSVKLAYD